MSVRPPSLQRITTVIAGVTLGVSLILVGVLTIQNRELAREAGVLRIRALLPAVGGALEPVRTVSVDGDSVVLGAGERQLLLVFNTRCAFCRATLPAWEGVAERIHALGAVRVIAVSFDGMNETRRYRDEHALGYPVALLPDRHAQALWGVHVVPATLLVDSTGTVLFARGGVIEPAAAADSVVQATALTSPQDLTIPDSLTRR